MSWRGGVSLVSAPSQPRIKGVKKNKIKKGDNPGGRGRGGKAPAAARRHCARSLHQSSQFFIAGKKKRKFDNFQMGSEGLISG